MNVRTMIKQVVLLFLMLPFLAPMAARADVVDPRLRPYIELQVAWLLPMMAAIAIVSGIVACFALRTLRERDDRKTEKPECPEVKESN